MSEILIKICSSTPRSTGRLQGRQGGSGIIRRLCGVLHREPASEAGLTVAMPFCGYKVKECFRAIYSALPHQVYRIAH